MPAESHQALHPLEVLIEGVRDGLALLSTPGGRAVGRLVALPGGRKALGTLRAWRDAADDPRYLVLVVRDVTGIGELVSHVQAGAAGDAVRWSQMRRGDIGIDRIVTKSPAMRAVAEKALQFAQVDSPVLIVGETGTGKTLFSRIIHQASARATARLREVNCGAIPAEIGRASCRERV
mgnify:CR=1 FL=1